jgi:hypothetical protein
MNSSLYFKVLTFLKENKGLIVIGTFISTEHTNEPCLLTEHFFQESL